MGMSSVRHICLGRGKLLCHPRGQAAAGNPAQGLWRSHHSTEMQPGTALGCCAVDGRSENGSELPHC